jgi:hypothetical protein
VAMSAGSPTRHGSALRSVPDGLECPAPAQVLHLADVPSLTVEYRVEIPSEFQNFDPTGLGERIDCTEAVTGNTTASVGE